MLNFILDVTMACAIGCVLLYILPALWSYLESAETKQDRTVFALTDDGWRIALHNYAPLGPKVGKPVILCHGIAGNRFIFDLNNAPSLANYLRSQNRDVWVAELRGSGFSGRPGLLLSDYPLNWSFDDHLNYDVEAIIRNVINETGEDSVHWVGHSMGGMLIEAYISRKKPTNVASAVALGSPTDFSGMKIHQFRHVLKMRAMLKIVPFNPLLLLIKCFIPVLRLAPGLLSVFISNKNIEWWVVRRISAIGTELVSSSVLWLDIARFLTEGKFADHSGRPYLEDIKESKTPLFAISGAKDIMAPPKSVSTVCEACGDDGLRKTLVLGKQTGLEQDYGHVDLLLGTRAREEVFPIIERWLARWDCVASHQ
jgi:pimeloyl-ACP methyl ester carboxylesterase